MDLIDSLKNPYRQQSGSIDYAVTVWRDRLAEFHRITRKKINLHTATGTSQEWTAIFKQAHAYAIELQGQSSICRRLWPDYDAALLESALAAVPVVWVDPTTDRELYLLRGVVLLLHAGGHPDNRTINVPASIEALLRGGIAAPDRRKGPRISLCRVKLPKTSPPKSQSIPSCEPPTGIKPVWVDSMEQLLQLEHFSISRRYCQKILVQRGFTGRAINAKKTPPRMQIWIHPEGIKGLRDR